MLFLFLFVCACASVSTHICVGVCAYGGQRPNSSVSQWALSATEDVGLLVPGSASAEIQLHATVFDFLTGLWNWSSGLLALKKAEPPSSSNPGVIS